MKRPAIFLVLPASLRLAGQLACGAGPPAGRRPADSTGWLANELAGHHLGLLASWPPGTGHVVGPGPEPGLPAEVSLASRATSGT